MSRIALPGGPFRTQPAGQAPLVRYGIGSGLALAGYRATGLVDHVSGGSWVNNSAGIAYTRDGPAWSTNGSSTYISRTDCPAGWANKTASFAVVVTPRALANDLRIFAFGSSSSNNPFAAIQTGQSLSTNGSFRLRNDANTLVQAEVAGTFTVGITTALVATWDGATMWLYTPLGSSSTAQTGTVTMDRTAIGCLLRAAAGSFFQGDVNAWAAWNRVLSPSEAQQFLINPWQLWASGSARWRVPAVFAGGAETAAGFPFRSPSMMPLMAM